MAWNTGLLVAGLLLLAMFVRAERRAQNPLIPRRLRQLPTLSGASAVAGGLTFTTTTAAVLLTLYLQRIHDLSPTAAGVMLAPGNVAIVLGSLAGSRLVDARGFGRTMETGLLLIAAALALCIVGLRTDELAWVVGGLIVNGLGLGSASVASTACGLSEVEDADRGTASGLITTAAMLGTALGISLLGGIADLWTRVRAGDEPITGGDLVGGYSVALALACVLILSLTRVARGAGSARG